MEGQQVENLTRLFRFLATSEADFLLIWGFKTIVVVPIERKAKKLIGLKFDLLLAAFKA